MTPNGEILKGLHREQAKGGILLGYKGNRRMEGFHKNLCHDT